MSKYKWMSLAKWGHLKTATVRYIKLRYIDDDV